MWKRVVWVVVILIFGLSSVRAQDDVKVVIGAENIGQLQSVNQINFDDLPENLGEVINGRFLLRDDGEHIAVVNRENHILVVDSEGDFIGGYFVADEKNVITTFLEGDFRANEDTIASIHTDGNFYYFAYARYTNGPPSYDNQPVGVRITTDRYVEVWTDTIGTAWVVYEGGTAHNIYYYTSDYFKAGPSADPESVIRIGRIEPPLAVTVTEDGRVKRWNMETGEVTAEVQINPEDGLPIYGALNAGGDSDLAWRDPASSALHILNFETGEDRTIVPLNGVYIPFIFLTQQSDVIIGVNIDDQPIVVAWDVATSERYDLGMYRQCNRPPDMVRLSQDGTTLVIGCDTGLDIWRISETFADG